MAAARMRRPGWVLAVLLASCEVAAPAPAPAPAPPALAGLWTASGQPGAILRLAADQLSTGGDLDPATVVTTPSAGLASLVAVAFDEAGTLWAVSADDEVLLGFAAADLAATGSRPASVVITANRGSLRGPTGLAFDRLGRLWIANHENGTVIGFDRSQLGRSGAPVPAVVLAGLGHPTALAFDGAGALWISDNVANRISRVAPERLRESGTPPAAVVLEAAARSLANPAGLAFDRAGMLWVANTGGQTVAGFGAADLAASGSPAPRVVLTSAGGSIAVPVGLAFGDDGSLWVVGGAGSLSRIPPESLRASGAPVPSARIAIAHHRLLWSAVFGPPASPETLESMMSDQ